MSNPVITIKNHASRSVFIESDPNWDDQVLLLNQQALTQIAELKPDQSAQLSVAWDGPANEYMMGVIFADGPDYDYGEDGFYQLTLGQQAGSGLLDVTEGAGEAKVGYTVILQAPWTMTMDFADN